MLKNHSKLIIQLKVVIIIYLKKMGIDMTKFYRYRIEIISNLSLELDIFECMEKIEQELGELIYYSKIENVYGKGRKGEKHGNGVWPEENFILIIYTSNQSIVNRLKDIVDDLNRSYPTEGINFFVLGN
ncbi:hypothetical protein BAPKO_0141 [Borreliella afzelii PKo]|nr:hypothetical protein BAPKO_0141 [Borreliella afzelii PKo]